MDVYGLRNNQELFSPHTSFRNHLPNFFFFSWAHNLHGPVKFDAKAFMDMPFPRTILQYTTAKLHSISSYIVEVQASSNTLPPKHLPKNKTVMVKNVFDSTVLRESI